MTDTELRVSKIQSGTVIDHVSAGAALHVLSCWASTAKARRPSASA